MNKIVSILILVSIPSLLSGQNELPIDTIRSFYLKAGANLELRSDFLKYFTESSPNSSIEEAYYAASVAMYAEIARGKRNQLNFFRKGRSLMDTVISNNPNNPELRYLRFDIQEHAPSMLFYNNKKEDVQVMLKEIGSFQDIGLDPLRIRIKEVLLKSDELTEEQKETVSKYL